jgi:hypothetical protein
MNCYGSIVMSGNLSKRDSLIGLDLAELPLSLAPWYLNVSAWAKVLET